MRFFAMAPVLIIALAVAEQVVGPVEVQTQLLQQLTAKSIKEFLELFNDPLRPIRYS